MKIQLNRTKKWPRQHSGKDAIWLTLDVVLGATGFTVFLIIDIILIPILIVIKNNNNNQNRTTVGQYYIYIILFWPNTHINMGRQFQMRQASQPIQLAKFAIQPTSPSFLIFTLNINSYNSPFKLFFIFSYRINKPRQIHSFRF